MDLITMILFASLALAQSQPHSIHVLDQPLNPNHPIAVGTYDATPIQGHAVWVIKGHDFVLDLSGRILRGVNVGGNDQSQNQGIGILLDGCTNVTLKGADLAGFQTDILLKNCKNVTVEACKANGSRSVRASQNGKPSETLLDLRKFDSWNTYGSGIRLEDCEACTLRNNQATQSQNGILLIDTNRCTVVQNDCSFNGGWGLAIWHGEYNTLAWNHADYCNRPSAGGWGGSSAGILGINGTYSNQFIANSLTHCGSGLVLTDQLDGGYDPNLHSYDLETGSNNNFIAHNDASWASIHAFESTYSQANLYYANQADDSSVGFYFRFSDSDFLYENEIRGNSLDGIAMGQCAHTVICKNRIQENVSNAVHIWSGTSPALMAHPSTADTLIENEIKGSKFAIRLEHAEAPAFLDNTVVQAELSPEIHPSSPSLKQHLQLMDWRNSRTAKRLDKWFGDRPKGWLFYRETKGPRGPQSIRVGEFAPLKPQP